MSDVNEKLLAAVHERKSFGGITTADRYVQTVSDCVGTSQCARLYGDIGSVDELIKARRNTLVYSNKDCVREDLWSSPGSWKAALPEGVELPAKTLMVFRHILSTPRKDRDGDILRSEGAELDEHMLLLWQHIHTLPIGKMIAVAEQNSDRIRLVSAIVDMNELSHDAAVMVEAKMGRFSHGFRAVEFEEMKSEDGHADPPSFDVKKWEVLEESLVSIPSNVDAQTEEILVSLVDGGKLTSGIVKSWAANVRETWPTQVSGVELRERIGDYERTVKGKADDVASLYTHALKDGSFTPNEVRSLAVTQLDADNNVGGTCGCAPKEDSLRWNRSLSKAFDVRLEQLEASKLEYDWVSRYLGCEIKDIFLNTSGVPSYRMGSWLTGLKILTKDWRVDDTRNITYRGKEEPPVHEVIQLNSKQSDDFLVEGLRFYQADGFKVVLKFSPSYGGIHVTAYTDNAHKEQNAELFSKAWQWAIDNNFLKGEAFALSGEFLPKTHEGWTDVFLEEENAHALQRTVDLLNEKGKGLSNRGAILMGPPGTGKTLSGRIIKNICEATFIWISSRDFYYSGAFGGLSSGFDLAKELAPAVLFIEDVDNWMTERAIDLMKTEMDGIGRHSGVWTVLTTNYPERFPKALIDRPGRFHDVLKFDLPTKAVRSQMLQKWLTIADAKQQLAAVNKTGGWSGAHIWELCEYAKTLADQDELPIGEALVKAIAKIEEQRKLIDEEQLAGSTYRPHKEVDTNDRLAMKFFGTRHTTAQGIGYTLLSAMPEIAKEEKAASASDATVQSDATSDADDLGKAIDYIVNASQGELRQLRVMIDALLKVKEQDQKTDTYRTLVRST